MHHSCVVPVEETVRAAWWRRGTDYCCLFEPWQRSVSMFFPRVAPRSQGKRFTTKHGSREVGLLRRWRCRPWLETLEVRCVLDVRSITGLGNNVAHPTWGMSGTDLLRVSPVAYADGISAPSTPNALNPRVISNNLGNQSSFIFQFLDDNGGPNKQRLSDYSYAWGQFIDHDMDLTLDNSGQPFDIPHDGRMFTQPDGTHVSDPIGTEPFTRSQFDPSTGTSTSNPRQQVNAVTSYLDLSQVYGSTDFIADALRSHSGGLLKTSPNAFLPLNNTTYFTTAQLAALNMANDAMQVPSTSLFAAGDRRANENLELTSLTTLFVRNHNRLAGQLAATNPANFGLSSWTDEALYQEARKLNIAEEEIIMYTGYIPSILGPNALPAFTAYNSSLNASIATEFSTVGFRFGHSLLSNTLGRDQNNGTGINDPHGSAVNLTEDFFRPDLLNNNHVTVNLVDRNGNPDPHISSTVGEVLKALADGTPNETDLLLIDEVRTLLFGIPNGPGTDLDARDVQRARDHGIGTYNQVRVAYGLPAVTSYTQISSDSKVQAALAGTYGPDTPANVNTIDPFEGMLAEDHVASDAGPTEKAILVKQFVALRDGDRLFYLNESFNSTETSLINEGNTLAKVIMNNTSITNLQTDVFTNAMEISGHVFADPDGNGVQGDTEPVLAGVTVDLADANGVALPGPVTAVTDATGEYDFTDQTGIASTGQYTVILDAMANPNLTQTAAQKAADPHPLISRGDFEVNNQDLGVISTEVNFLNGFASTAGLQLNGSAKVSGSNLRLTDGGNNEAASTFTTSQVSIARFSTFFNFQLTNANADGFTFTIQRQAPTALGASGGGLGYGPDHVGGTGGIPNSAAIKFDLFNNQGEGSDSTGLYFNGASPTVPSVDLSNTGIDLHSGHRFDGRIDYDGSTLTLRIDDDVTGAVVEVIFSGVNIPGAIGGSTAFVGFTGGTGGLTATQDIQNWNFIPITSGGVPATGEGGPSNVTVVVGGSLEGTPPPIPPEPDSSSDVTSILGSQPPASNGTGTGSTPQATNQVTPAPNTDVPAAPATVPSQETTSDATVSGTALSSSNASDPLAADNPLANPL
jgi:hypothetical protein